MRVKSLQLCPTLCDPMDCSPPGSSVQRILQAGILKWVVLSFSRGSSQPRDRTHVSMSPALAGRFFTISATWEAQGPLEWVATSFSIHTLRSRYKWYHSRGPWASQVALMVKNLPASAGDIETWVRSLG